MNYLGIQREALKNYLQSKGIKSKAQPPCLAKVQGHDFLSLDRGKNAFRIPDDMRIIDYKRLHRVQMEAQEHSEREAFNRASVPELHWDLTIRQFRPFGERRPALFREYRLGKGGNSVYLDMRMFANLPDDCRLYKYAREGSSVYVTLRTGKLLAVLEPFTPSPIQEKGCKTSGR